MSVKVDDRDVAQVVAIGLPVLNQKFSSLLGTARERKVVLEGSTDNGVYATRDRLRARA